MKMKARTRISFALVAMLSLLCACAAPGDAGSGSAEPVSGASESAAASDGGSEPVAASKIEIDIGNYAYARHTFMLIGASVAVDEKILDGATIEFGDNPQTDIFSTAKIFTSANVLYRVTETAAEKIAGNVIASRISQYGDTIAYMDMSRTLYLYSVEGGAAAKIADEVEDHSLAWRLSPDGQTLLFSVLREGELTGSPLYLYANGMNTYLCDGFGLAVSDSGNVCYYDLDDRAFYFRKAESGDRVRLSDDVWGIISNIDRTQMIFTDVSRRIYLLDGDGNTEQIAGSAKWLKMVLPDGAFLNDEAPVTYPCESLLNNLFSDEAGNILYINDSLECETVAHGVDVKEANGSYVISYFFQLAADGKTLYYRKGGDLYRISFEKGTASEKIAGFVKDFVATPDGSFVYYVNQLDQLYVLRGDVGEGESESLADNIYEAKMSHDGFLFFLSNYVWDTDIESGLIAYGHGNLYACEGGGILGKIASGVSRLETTATAAYYSADGVTRMDSDGEFKLYAIYATMSGMDFTKIQHDSVDSWR